MSQRRSLFSIPLVRELTIVLVIKLGLIIVIANVFFADPVEIDPEGTRVDEVFGIRAESVSLPQEIHHDQ